MSFPISANEVVEWWLHHEPVIEGDPRLGACKFGVDVHVGAYKSQTAAVNAAVVLLSNYFNKENKPWVVRADGQQLVVRRERKMVH